MHRTSLPLIAALSLACSPAPESSTPPLCYAPPLASMPAKPPRNRIAEIDVLATRARELFAIPGFAIAVVHRDQVVFARGFGERELGRGMPVDERTSFAIASNTKAFVATAVGLLVAEGKLGWDDRVIDHLPDLQLWNDYVTRELRVRDLLSHRVGLETWAGDMLWISSKFSFAQVYARLRHLSPKYGMRERYGYCNLMYGVAGELIRVKSGKPWDSFVRERLLAPLGMEQTATDITQLAGRDNLALPHIQVDDAWQTTARLDLQAIGPAASLDASVLDMTQWLRMQLADGKLGEREIVPASVIRETRQPHMWIPGKAEDFYQPARHLRGYGLGWYLEDYRGRLLVSHGGGLPGMTSRVLLVPEEQLGIVVLTNSESSASGLLALQIADLFLSDVPGKDYMGEAAAKRAEAEQAEAEQAKLAPTTSKVALPTNLEGEYQSPLLGAARISKSDDGLWFEAHEHGGLRCRFDGEAELATDGSTPLVPCTWTDPNMGVSVFTVVGKGKRASELRFRVRPSFYDPYEYAFARRR